MAHYHVYNQTVADGTATSVVRPSDWNSAHNIYQTISGNTAGQSTVSGTNLVFQGGNNVTLSAATAAGAATIVFSAANDLTSGRAGTGFTSTTTAGTAVVGTLGTNGLSMAVPQYITTYVNDLTSGRAGTGFTSTTTAGTAIVATQNTAGLSMGVPAFLTTAAQSNHSHNLATTTTNGSQIVIATANSAGATMAVPPFITTYAAQTNQTANFYANGNTTQLSSTAGVDLRSVSFEGAGIASVGVSAGRVLISVPTGGGAGDGYNIVAMGTDPVGGGATSGATFSTLSGSIYLQAGNNMTLSQTSNSIVISGQDMRWELEGANTAGTTQSNLSANWLYLSGGNNVTLSGNSNTIVINAAAGGGGTPENNFMPHANALWAAAQVGQNSIQVQPMCGAPYATYDRLAYAVQYTQATNSTLTVSATIHMGVYSLNGSTLSQITSGSGSFSINGSGTASSNQNSGPRWATMTFNAGGTISGDVWIAFKSSTATAGANATLSNIVASRINSSWSGFMGVVTANSAQSLPGMGYYSATSNAMPSSMAISHITGVSSTAQRPQVFFLTNGALPI